MSGPVRAVFWALAWMTSSAAHAGAQLTPANSGQIIETAAFSEASSAFEATRADARSGVWRSFEARTWFEWGLTASTTLIVELAAERIDPGQGSPAAGVEPLSIGARRALREDPQSTLSYQVSALSPASSAALARALATGRGPGFDLRLLYSRAYGLPRGSLFVDGEAAWRFIGEADASEILLQAGLGLRPNAHWTLMLQSFGSIEIAPSSYAAAYGRANYDNAQISATYAVNASWSLQGAAFMTVLGARALRQRGLSLSVIRNF